jgi:hypothetical protein
MLTGNQIELQGLGFGIKETAPPILYDQIDNIEAYEEYNLTLGDTIPTIHNDGCSECPWHRYSPDWQHYHKPTYYDSANVRVPGRPAYHVNRAGFFRSDNPFATLNESSKIYMSWWIRATHNLYDNRPATGVVFNKLIRYTTGWSEYEVYEGHVEIESQFIAAHPETCGTTIQPLNGYFAELAPHEWHHIELLYDGGGNLPHGSAHLSVTFDGASVCDYDGLYSCTGIPDHIFVWGSDPHMPLRYPDDSEILFGEFYVDSTRARVILSDSDSYSWQNPETVHCEIQPPVAWSDESITIDFNAGILPPDQNRYLYVIDADGNISPPFPLEGVE